VIYIHKEKNEIFSEHTTQVKDSEMNIFSRYAEQKTVFRDKNVLQSSFIPEKIEHRDAEIDQLVAILAPILKGYASSNIFIYGPCGTGKTISTKYVVNHLNNAVIDIGLSNLRTIYINAKMKKVADTEYRLFAQLLREFGCSIPDSGLPTNAIYRRFFEEIDKQNQNIIIIIDEIDTLFKKIGDDFLYNLTRMNNELEKSRVSIIGITNDLSFRESLDQRVKSSLSEEEILFKPYNALQLRDILTNRAESGFIDGSVDGLILNKCAAIAAQEHGDARRALDLLRVSGEIAERLNSEKIGELHVDMAKEKIELDRVTETVRNQPAHSKLVLVSIIRLSEVKKQPKSWSDSRILTGDVFELYKDICAKNNISPLTQRRISDLIGELDMLGIITANVISKGRYGRTREIHITLESRVKENVLRMLKEKYSI